MIDDIAQKFYFWLSELAFFFIELQSGICQFISGAAEMFLVLFVIFAKHQNIIEVAQNMVLTLEKSLHRSLEDFGC